MQPQLWDGPFAPGSAMWRLTRERALLLGGGRALLLQLAHPLVAAGVAEHSVFPDDVLGRLYRTLSGTLALVFGTHAESERAAERIRRAHLTVKGTLPETSGRFEAGTPYDACDPDLLLWVHATLVDTTLQVYPLLVEPLDASTAERYYAESIPMAVRLGVPEEMVPPDLTAFRRWWNQTLATDIAIAPFQRDLGRHVLLPTISRVPPQIFWPSAAFTIWLLPPAVRDAFGFALTPARSRAASVTRSAVRGMLPFVPKRFREWPEVHRALKRQTTNDQRHTRDARPA